MGGNALGIPVMRFNRAQGQLVVDSLTPAMNRMFQNWGVAKSIKEKKEFGDIDIICSGPKVKDYKLTIRQDLQPQATSTNSNVHSFEHMGVQVDLIVVPEDQFTWAYYYYSNNDLGNLIGRIARAIGFKFGGQGFVYEFSRDHGNFHKDLIVTMDLKRALSFLGFPRFEHSFAEFTDMYRYVLSSCLSDPTMYLLENRNFEGRHRDKKRQVYLNFLVWLQDQYDMKMLTRPLHNKSTHLMRARRLFPFFNARLQEAEAEFQVYKAQKDKFNGKIVMDITGLKGEELGKFIKAFKENIHFKNWLNDPNVDMKKQIFNFFLTYVHPNSVKVNEPKQVLASEG